MDDASGEIFISYKSERRRAAEHLAETLRRYGYTVWFDYQLVKGRNFALQIDARSRCQGAYRLVVHAVGALGMGARGGRSRQETRHPHPR
jgi:TIR domain